MFRLIAPATLTIDNKKVSFCNAQFAYIYNLGYLTADEYLLTREDERLKSLFATNAPLIVYVNGVYKGITRSNEQIMDVLERLRIVQPLKPSDDATK